jgi:hypothetical protein
MSSRNSHNMIPVGDARSKKSRVGCCSLVAFCAGVLVCLWLTMTVPSLARALLSNKLTLTIPLPGLSGLVPTQLPASPRHVPAFYTVMDQPSLSAALVNRVLARAHSPAAGTGQSLYALSVHYHIDDAFALAFFEHESGFGTTGMARVTRSLGNIRCSAGYHCINGYRAYPNWPAGYDDWYHLIEDGYVQGHITVPLVGHTCTTVSQIVPVYAPASDGNDVAGYILAVEQAVDGWREEGAQR